MPLNPDLVGKTYAPVTFPLDPERVRSFAAAVGHTADDVPPTIVVAPEFEAGLRSVLGDQELGLELSRVLHGEQEYEWARSLIEDEDLTATASIEGIRGRAGLELLVLRTEVRDERGDVVATGRSTLIVRGGG
jgi:hypothetical protein